MRYNETTSTTGENICVTSSPMRHIDTPGTGNRAKAYAAGRATERFNTVAQAAMISVFRKYTGRALCHTPVRLPHTHRPGNSVCVAISPLSFTAVNSIAANGASENINNSRRPMRQNPLTRVPPSPSIAGTTR